MSILITSDDWWLKSFGIEKGCTYFAEKLPNGNYEVWDPSGDIIEVMKEHCVEVEG